ncbi:MAG: ferredoxin [Subtercola sp.]|nr:ferredoxin [Subtercola sp.]
MPIITYILPDSTERRLEVPTGQTVMEGSVRNNLPGIIAECGGGCSCATCHVYVDAAWAHAFVEANDDEAALVEFADGACAESRLACQLVVTEAADGARVTVANN